MGPPLFARLSNASFDPIAQDVAFELGEDREHPGQGSAAGRRQVERFAERDETHIQ